MQRSKCIRRPSTNIIINYGLYVITKTDKKSIINIKCNTLVHCNNEHKIQYISSLQ